MRSAVTINKKMNINMNRTINILSTSRTALILLHITFVRDVPCVESGKCPCFEKGYCSERDYN